MRLIKFFLFSMFILDIIVSVESEKVAKKGKLAEKAPKKGKEPKKTKESPVEEFLPFALDFLEGINTRLCLREDLSAVCERVAGLVARGTPFIDAIEPYYYINFRAMTLAYPLFSVGTERKLFTQVHRVHRTLGYGNNLRLQGHTDDTVNRAYWSHWNVLTLEDENFLPPGDGIDTYCRYISNEYEMLKAFAVENVDEDFSASPVFGATPMYNACMSTETVVSYIIRSDWESHRREMIGSLMSSKKTKSIVEYTIWHWESLFAGSIPGASELVTQQLFNSFNALIPIP